VTLKLAALACGAALAALCLEGSAKAQGALVTTVVDPCVPVDPRQLDRLLGIELGTSASAGAALSGTGPTHVRVGCVPAGIELHLVDALTRKEMVRVLSRDSFTDASSTRLLALAIAEFVVASWVELRLPQKVEPVGPPPSQTARRAATQAIERKAPAATPEASVVTDIALTGAVQAWSAQGSVFYGGALRLQHAPSELLAFSIAADLGLASRDTSLGSVLVRTTGVSVAVLARIPTESFVFSTGPGGRLGLAQITASLSNPEAARSRPGYLPYGGIFWLGRAAWMLTSAFALVLDLELGAATLPARAVVDDNIVVALEGVWLGLGLGLSLSF
jgi:hypothetical protein